MIHQNFSRALNIIQKSKRDLPAAINSVFSVICELHVCESRSHNIHNQAIRLCSLLPGVSSRHSFAVITQCNRVVFCFFSPHALIVPPTAGAAAATEARKINQPNQFRESDESAPFSYALLTRSSLPQVRSLKKTASVMHACARARPLSSLIQMTP